MLHALNEIRRILQIEEKISISCQTSHQTLTYTGMDMVAVHFLLELSQYPGKVNYKPSILDEKQLHRKQH